MDTSPWSQTGGIQHCSFRALKMTLWMLLTFTALADFAPSCLDLCNCSFTPSGVKVECTKNTLTHFPTGYLPSNTTQLSFISNNLSSITASHLSALPLLKELVLYYNNLTSLPSDLLKGVPHLIKLDLTGNQLVHLPPNVFTHALLRSLVLKYNLIEKADAEWIQGNSSITWLDLSGNRLTLVPAALLQKMPNLEDLDLSDNKLQHLEPEALKNLHRLKTLNVAGNKLSTLKPTTFTHNLELSMLYLQENQLQELPATLFHGLQNLALLMLNNNQLQQCPSGLLDNRTSSFQVTLTGNPWMCDKKIEYLWRWLTAHPQNAIFLDEVTCEGPEALKHREVVSLTDREFGFMI